MPRKTANLNRELFSVTSAKTAFYKFRKLHAADISLDDNQQIVVTFNFPDILSSDEQEQILVDFRHEVADCSLRETISKETELARNLILANAFSNTTLTESDE